MEKWYKDEIWGLGASEIAALTLVGMKEGNLSAEILNFGGDGNYIAYLVKDKDVEIPSHYDLIYTGQTWLKIFDDDHKVFDYHKYGSVIEIYRAGDYGVIIRILD